MTIVAKPTRASVRVCRASDWRAQRDSSGRQDSFGGQRDDRRCDGGQADSCAWNPPVTASDL